MSDSLHRRPDPKRPSPSLTPDGWRSFHLVYGGDLDQLLHGVLIPFKAHWINCGALRRFFFMRYDLGGKHLRLRLEHDEHSLEAASALEADLRMRCSEFFRLAPSSRPSDEEIQRINHQIMANDPAATDIIEPNDSVQRRPFHPEVQRYGGPKLLDASYDYFMASSQRVLTALSSTGEPLTETRRLGLGLCLLAEQCVQLTGSPGDVPDLLAEIPVYWRQEGSKLIDRGDSTFENQPGPALALAGAEIAAHVDGDFGAPPRESLRGPARVLSTEIRGASKETRRRIAISQLHMTSNRLGLRVAEEVYLSRLLWRAMNRALSN